MNGDIAIGIDAGTSNSETGVFQNHKVEIIPNSIGDSYTPSKVAFLDEGISVGEEIMLHKIDMNNNKNLITEIKRIVGRKYSSLTSKEKEKYNIIEDPKTKDQILLKIKYKGKEETFSPEMILSFIFKKLIKIASDYIGTSITKAVITVPAYFGYEQRGAITESAKMAGIEVMRVISEPVAAALAYGLGTQENLKNSLNLSIMQQDNKNERKILVFDLGGGTFDVTILNLKDNRDFEVIDKAGDKYLGGNDFDNILVDFCIKKFCSNNNIEENELRKEKNILIRLKNQCEKAKKKLSYMNETIITVFNLYKDNNLRVEIKREEFDEICDDLYEKILSTLNKTLLNSKLSYEQIDDVVLVGGSSRIPKIKELLIEKFGINKIRDQINPDEAVAIGATWQAHKLIQSNLDINILDTTPFTLGVETKSKNKEEANIGTVMSVLIEKNQKIPCKSEIKSYHTSTDNQSCFLIRLYAGENRFCELKGKEKTFYKCNDLLKEFKIDNLPKGEAGSVNLEILLKIDTDGIVSIIAEVKSIGKTVTESYSLYQKKENETKISVRFKKNGELEKIKELTEFLKMKNQNLEKSENEEDKLKILKCLEENYSELIEIYEKYFEQNDSDDIYQKLFKYYQTILKYYSQMILLDKDEKNIDIIIDKIKKILNKFINDDIETLVNEFNNLKEIKINEYCTIIIYCAKLLYQEGEKILNEGKKFCRYQSRKFFVKGDKIKSKIDENMKEQINFKVNKLYKELEEKSTNKVGQIDAFTKIIKNFIEEKKTPYTKTGFTAIRQLIDKYMEPENIDLALDIFAEMADSLSKDKNNLTEEEAYCLYNIISIKYNILENQDLNNIKVYEKLMSRIKFILERLETDEDPKWANDFYKIKNDILKKKEEELKKKEEELIKKNDIPIKLINEIYYTKMKEKKPMEFLDYLIDNYPFNDIEEVKDELKMKNLENKFNFIFGRYHPDNFKYRDDFYIYNEIYKLLVEMEKKLFKKK